MGLKTMGVMDAMQVFAERNVDQGEAAVVAVHFGRMVHLYRQARRVITLAMRATGARRTVENGWSGCDPRYSSDGRVSDRFLDAVRRASIPMPVFEEHYSDRLDMEIALTYNKGSVLHAVERVVDATIGAAYAQETEHALAGMRRMLLAAGVDARRMSVAEGTTIGTLQAISEAAWAMRRLRGLEGTDGPWVRYEQPAGRDGEVADIIHATLVMAGVMGVINN